MCDSGALVIDNGTGSCVAGFAGYDVPTTDIPSIVGHQKYEVCLIPKLFIQEMHVIMRHGADFFSS